jgi:ribosomal-protein-alanine N-acetyltransferase
MSHSLQAISEERLSELCAWDASCFPKEPWTEKMLLSHLEFHAGFTCEEQGTRGYALICETPWEVEVFRIATLPTYFRSGVAKFMLSSLFVLFPNKDFFLEVKETNLPARNLYEKVGFEVLEIRKNYYPDQSTAVIMTRKKES